MINEYQFIRVYKSVAYQSARESELTKAYWDLQEKLNNNQELGKWFQKSLPSPIDSAIAIDAVAHYIHQGDEETLLSIFPTAEFDFVKSELDKLAGLEKTNEVRKYNRGYFTTLLSEDTGVIFLEKSLPQFQIGRTVKEAIFPAIKEYGKLYKAGLASPAEILTLHRYYPENPEYKAEVEKLELMDGASEPMVVGGPASVEMVDKEGHLVTVEALDKAFKRFMKNFRARNIQVLHSDVQVGWVLPAYITKDGRIFSSGVDDKQLWVISELRGDTKIANRVADEIKNGNMRSYSIAGSAEGTETVEKGLNKFLKVKDMELSEITLCPRGMNPGAMFDILKSDEEKSGPTVETLLKSLEEDVLSIPGFGVLIDISETPKVVIKADRTNSLTELIASSISKAIPSDSQVVVYNEEDLSVSGLVPIYKIQLVPVWKAGDRSQLLKNTVSPDEDVEAAVKPISGGHMGRLKNEDDLDWYVSLRPELKEAAKKEGRNLAESCVKLFKEWVDKNKSGDEVLRDYEGRSQKHNNLLDEQGFPKEQDAESLKNPVIEERPEPWLVNEAGEGYDEEVTSKEKAKIRGGTK